MNPYKKSNGHKQKQVVVKWHFTTTRGGFLLSPLILFY